MPKKKTPSKVKVEPKVKAEPTAQQKKLAKPPKQMIDEIDEIFESKKRKNPEVEESEKPKEKVKGVSIKKEKEKKKKKKSEGSRRKTNDGLSIYSASELGINKEGSGFTPGCPFDCSCCF